MENNMNRFPSPEVIAADTLFHARRYLANLPMEDQNFEVINNHLVNSAIPILWEAECLVRMLEAKQMVEVIR